MIHSNSNAQGIVQLLACHAIVLLKGGQFCFPSAACDPLTHTDGLLVVAQVHTL